MKVKVRILFLQKVKVRILFLQKVKVRILFLQIAALLVEREQSILRARKMAETSAKLREIIKAQYWVEWAHLILNDLKMAEKEAEGDIWRQRTKKGWKWLQISQGSGDHQDSILKIRADEIKSDHRSLWRLFTQVLIYQSERSTVVLSGPRCDQNPPFKCMWLWSSRSVPQ